MNALKLRFQTFQTIFSNDSYRSIRRFSSSNLSFHCCSEDAIKMLSIPKDQVQPKPKPVVIPKSNVPKPNAK